MIISVCRTHALSLAVVIVVVLFGGGRAGARGRVVAFEKQAVSDATFESAGVLDADNDGDADIVSGAWWYEGPEFTQRHRVGDVKAAGEYYDDFSTIPLDINGDGFMDFVTGGWWGGTLRWRQNPGDPAKPWPEHVVAKTGNIETTRAWDVDGDGLLELVPNTPGGPLVVYDLVTDDVGNGTGVFEAHRVYDKKQGHGLGFGDINGDGRGDVVLAGGWLEAPAKPYAEPWVHHADFKLGSASVPILVEDVDGDGDRDLIVGQAHAYGLHWWEQTTDGGTRAWTRRAIDPFNSQYHDLVWADIDGDRAPELVTGKRYRAHNGHDPGSTDPLGVYYFEWTGDGFVKQVVDHGMPDGASGVGIHFVVADVNGDGKQDIVAPGKEGLYLFRAR